VHGRLLPDDVLRHGLPNTVEERGALLDTVARALTPCA